ncbi:uncharacterized protein SCHCODRAFT_02465856, partial [Schizophyllum commune H4-8]|uniref:uncharacterized protein n=1 Tax=Schizophyllum commune (strain H4-8 / FGSC 9210) TaxID=578458 RepID=UPI002160423A
MPVTTIAEGVFSNQGRLPHIADSKEAATSLGGPRTCARLLHAFRSYGTIAKLQDGDIMDTFIHAFESPKMQQDLRRTAAAKSYTFRTMTYEQFFDVLRDTFIRGGSTKLFDDFQDRARADKEHPLDFYNGLEESNFDLPAELRVSQMKIIERTILSFGRKFTNFCRGKDQFAKLLKWTLPTVDESDEASVDAYNASIKDFTTVLTTAWDAHRDFLDEFADAVSDGMKALDNDLRKRGLSTASHSAQLPEPKRPAFASNAAQPPRSSTYGQQPAYAQQSAPPHRWSNQVTAVNAISSRPPARVLTKADVLAKKEVLIIPLDLNPRLVGHFITITIFSGCYFCFKIRANHRASDCPNRGQSFKPPFPLDCTEVEDYLIAQTYFTHYNEERERRGITLQEIVANVNPGPFAISPAYTQPAARAPARGPATNANSIPVGTRVNAVPAQVARISPDSSFEGPPAQPQPVNYIAYTQNDLARSYASTGLRGRVNHIANVRRHSDMGLPAVPRAAPAPSQPARDFVSASFGDYSDDDAGYDDDYISQPAPPAGSGPRALRGDRDDGAVIHTHRSTSKARAYARSSSRSLSRARSPSRSGFGREVVNDRSRSRSRSASVRSRPRSVMRGRSSALPSRAASPVSTTPERRHSLSVESAPAAGPSKRALVSPARHRSSSPLTPLDSPVPSPPPTPPSPSPAPRARAARTDVSSSSPARARTLSERPAIMGKGKARASLTDAAPAATEVCALPRAPLPPLHHPLPHVPGAVGTHHAHAIPHALPHLFWKCVVGSPESSLATRVRALIDDGSPFVLIREDLRSQLRLRVHRLAEPELLGVAMDGPDGAKVELSIDSYSLLSLQDRSLSFQSHTVKALIVPSLHVPLLLGLPFLALNDFRISYSLRRDPASRSRVFDPSVICMATGFDILHPPRLPASPATATTRTSPKDRRIQICSDRLAVVSELNETLAGRRVACDAHTTPPRHPSQFVCAILETIETLEHKAKLEAMSEEIKSDFKDVFGPIAHVDDLDNTHLCKIDLRVR